MKDRILEHLAVRKLQAERGLAPVGGRGAGAILALVGPPGVGKTSLGESVARALGRTFVRVALGGVRDEAEIRGHRRTYVGAQPGRLVRALREAGTMNPVIVLDEVDKLGADYRGDPSSALLEVLDPAQNHTFRDHYLEVELDLSKVLFLATANVVDTIPGPLLDRMEVIRLDGYTEDEKVAIARHHLVGRQRERAALADGDVTVTDEALRSIVGDYTREAGVRSLERELGRLLRKVAARIAGDPSASPITVDADDVREWLGRPTFFFESADRTAVPGVATGLAVTGTGGDVLYVEATMMDGPEGLTLTGQLGDVMKESAEIALSYVRSHADDLGIDPAVFAGKRFHLHVPAGAIPKDGPSAGVTMTTALVSLLRDVPVRSVLGMTGEVTLQGRVLPIGGVRQKVLAAHRAGLTSVVLPVRNGPDLEDVPEPVRDEMTFHLASDVTEVLGGGVGLGRGGGDRGRRAGGPEPARRRLTVGRLSRRPGRCRGSRPARGVDHPGCCDRHRSTVTTRSAGRRRRNSASSASSTTGESAAPDQEHGGLDGLEVVPQRPEVDRAHVHPAGAGGTTQLVAPGPATVLPLHRVVQDPSAQGRLRPGGIELDGALEDLVEGREALRSGQEGGDVRALLAGDPGRDVDEGQLSHQTRMGPGQGHGGRAAEGHPHHHPGRRGQHLDDRGHVLGHGPGIEHGVVARPVRVPVSGQVDGHQGPVEGQGHRVPGVGVLPPAMEEHRLGAVGPPHQGADPPARGHLDELPPHGGGPVQGSPTSLAFSWKRENSS